MDGLIFTCPFHVGYSDGTGSGNGDASGFGEHDFFGRGAGFASGIGLINGKGYGDCFKSEDKLNNSSFIILEGD